MHYKSRKKLLSSIEKLKNNNLMVLTFSQTVQKAVEIAIRETNRCLVINGLNNNNAHIIMEKKALFKTWFCRQVRPYIGWSTTNYLFDGISMSVIFEIGHNPYISKCSIDIRRVYEDHWDLLTGIFESINYESLKYEPEYKVGSSYYSRQKSFLQTIKEVDISSIETLLASIGSKPNS